MTQAEINRLFDLLRELHGKDKPRNERTLAIWGAVLEPWSYPQVRAAAVERSRENRYYPDPAELASLLPKPPAPAGREEPAGGDWRHRFQRRWGQAMAAEGESPTLACALASGMTAAGWWGQVARRQLADREWMARLTPDQQDRLRRYARQDSGEEVIR